MPSPEIPLPAAVSAFPLYNSFNALPLLYEKVDIPTMKKIIILSVIFILLVVFGFFAQRAPASPPAAESGEPAVPPAEPAPPQLSPELLKERVLLPAISFHPGTAGSSLGCAQAAAAVVSFATEYRFHSAGEDVLNRMTEDAAAMLAEEEAEWLRENLPGLIGMVDSAYSDYTSARGIFDDAGAGGTIEAALASENSAEDWMRLKAAMERLEDNSVS